MLMHSYRLLHFVPHTRILAVTISKIAGVQAFNLLRKGLNYFHIEELSMLYGGEYKLESNIFMSKYCNNLKTSEWHRTF